MTKEGTGKSGQGKISSEVWKVSPSPSQPGGGGEFRKVVKRMWPGVWVLLLSCRGQTYSPFLPGHPSPTLQSHLLSKFTLWASFSEFANSLGLLFLSSSMPLSLLSALLCPEAVMKNGF